MGLIHVINTYYFETVPSRMTLCYVLINTLNVFYFFIFFNSLLKVYKLEAYGTYQFQIKAENKFGVSDGCESEKVELKDPFGLPGPPQRPRIIGHTRSSMLVTWEPPKDNGGSTIQGYWLEKRERGAVYWSRVNRAPVTKPAVKGLEYNVLHLIEGAEYKFRVMAQNAAGVGPPSESTECVFALDPRSK